MLTRVAILPLVFLCVGASPLAAQTLPTEIQWSVTLPAEPAAPPLIAGDRIYVALKSGIVAAHRAGDGAELWRKDFSTSVPLASDGSRLFVAAGEAIYAIEADGSPAWHAAAGTLTAPMLVHDGWVVAAAGGQVTAYRASDGTAVWRREIAGITVRPAIEGATLYLSVDDGRLLALDLPTGNPKWERRLGGAPTEALPFADHVFVGSADKHFYCLDADDGRISWPQRIGAALRGRATADAERVYIVALDNALRAFDRSNGALRWSPRPIPFRPAAGPVLLGELLAVAGPTSEIRAFVAKTGDPAGQLTLPGSLAALPDYVVTGASIRVAAATGSLTQEWKLSLAVSSSRPSLAVEPLSALPGQPVPIPTPPER